MKQINLRVSDSLVAEIDWARGDVARNLWLTRAVEARLAYDAARVAAWEEALKAIEEQGTLSGKNMADLESFPKVLTGEPETLIERAVRQHLEKRKVTK